MASEHYTATVAITRTVPPSPAPTTPPPFGRRLEEAPRQRPEREVEEVGRLVLRDESLDMLIERVAVVIRHLGTASE